ncbi:MAG: hypothetical protein K9W44_11395 [Candidatus Lokiarchaeota archaeon]|nr:hypothetical protein [Candidatus Harpocratesius repetitus]
MWEDPNVDFDPQDPPYMKTNGVFGPDFNFKYFNMLYLAGIHRTPTNKIWAHLTHFPDLFPTTEHLYLEDQFLTELPEWINHLAQLETVTLILYNLISFRADFFTCHPKLRALYLYLPLVSKLPDLFEHLPVFRTLCFYNSKNLRSLPNSLFHNSSIQRIEVYPPTSIGISVPQWNSVYDTSFLEEIHNNPKMFGKHCIDNIPLNSEK